MPKLFGTNGIREILPKNSTKIYINLSDEEEGEKVLSDLIYWPPEEQDKHELPYKNESNILEFREALLDDSVELIECGFVC